MTTPIFTRYLYEKTQVEESLLESMLEKQREESIFWAYELYHSGYKQETWQFVMNIYLQYYANVISNQKYKLQLEKYYIDWLHSRMDCLLGTVVGTLAHWDNEKTTNNEKKRQFIILYKEDRHQTMDAVFPARHYLKYVTAFPIRKSKTDLDISESYLGNWLYYCRTPIWKERIESFGGRIEENDEVVFETDEQLEEFYDRWGFEPDEQSMQMHNAHGVYTFA